MGRRILTYETPAPRPPVWYWPVRWFVSTALTAGAVLLVLAILISIAQAMRWTTHF